MSTPTEPADPPTPPVEPPAPGDPAPAADPPLGPPGEKALTEWKQRAKDAEKLTRDQAARLKEFEDAKKTESEKLADQLAAAEERATKATRMAVASRVQAMATGRFADPSDAVDAIGADFLTADGQIDDAAIAAALEALLERKPHWKADAGPRTPRPDPSQGARPGGTVGVDDQIREAQSKGDWRTAMRLQTSKLAAAPKPK